MDEIKEIFKTEAEEIMQHLETEIVNLEEQDDPETINTIFRYVHTIKGSSGIAGFTGIAEFTHKLENLLDAVRNNEVQIGESLIDIMLDSMDWIKFSIFGGDDDIDLDEMKGPLISRIAELREPGKAGAQAAEAKPAETAEQKPPEKTEDNNEEEYKFFRVKIKFRENIFEFGLDPLMLIEDLASLGRMCENIIDRTALPDNKDFDPEKCYLGWNIVIRTNQPAKKIEEVFLFVMDDNDISIEDVTSEYRTVDIDSLPELKKIGEIMVEEKIISEDELDAVLDIQDTKNKKIAEIMVEKGYATDDDVKFALDEQEKIKKKVETTTVRVATGKLDKLLNLLGEIVIGQSSISRVADELAVEDGFKVKNAVYGLDRITREFQEQIMSIRMIPIGPTFEQFRRFVRDTAKQNGKEIRIAIEGGETELDKTVIERIGDPLKHMIRNSIDHGIEMPEERKKAGKNSRGHVILKAYHQEGNIYIEITDDGGGIDKEKVRAKAEKVGLIKPGEEVSEDRILSLLFHPGFSTAEKVGALSGRGVGMDVVKTNIEALRGTVNIITRKGKGTTFRIKLPLTLAIIEGMLVRVGKNTYIIPLLSIVESIQPDKDGLKSIEGKGEAIFVRGEYVSFIRLHKLFGVKPDFTNPWESLVVIVESNGTAMGLMVDELIGQQQIVIKSMESQVTNSRAVSGASILGNGSVSLILDIHGLAAELAVAS
ncbi:MAG: chemotaxis protein CheA [bacterium]|nr:chemotaxis protein CheA [bacterium]